MAKQMKDKSDVVVLVAEIFRELGYEGTSFNAITDRTGVSKGSLYHFFPGGKQEMAREVLAHIDLWFGRNMFEPLVRDEPHVAIDDMWKAVDAYFHSGRRICLIGAFALDETRDSFAPLIRDYFARWIDALRLALMRAGCAPVRAQNLSEEAVAGIQGALVLARALNEDAVFTRASARLKQTLERGLMTSKSRSKSHQDR